MLNIRQAEIQDAGLLATMIKELAEFERLPHAVVMTEADLRRDGFGSEPRFRALIAEWNLEAAGYALFCGAYSSFEGRPGFFLEDLFVRAPFRNHRIGKALLARVARIAQEENCYGVRWEVLDWNEGAIRFYKSLDSTFRDPWKNVLLRGEALRRLAAEADTN